MNEDTVQTAIEAIEEVRTKPLADKRCEEAILASIFCCANWQLLASLDLNDFYYPDTQLIFEELRLMREAGEPMNDFVAQVFWFTSDMAKKRAATSKAKEKNLAALAGAVFGQFATAAHDWYYLKVLRRNRLRRSMRRLALELLDRNDKQELEPWNTLEWLQTAYNQIWEKAAEVYPIEVAGESE